MDVYTNMKQSVEKHILGRKTGTITIKQNDLNYSILDINVIEYYDNNTNKDWYDLTFNITNYLAGIKLPFYAKNITTNPLSSHNYDLKTILEFPKNITTSHLISCLLEEKNLNCIDEIINISKKLKNN